jgi:phospholipid N-methyltransferase
MQGRTALGTLPSLPLPQRRRCDHLKSLGELLRRGALLVAFSFGENAGPVL